MLRATQPTPTLSPSNSRSLTHRTACRSSTGARSSPHLHGLPSSADDASCRPSFRNSIIRILDFIRHSSFPCIPFPHILQRLRQRLPLRPPVHVPGVLAEHELVVVSLFRQRFGQSLVGQNPIVHVIPHEVGVQQITVAHLHPDADRL